ncbi:MAG: hypothetical protein AAF348_11570 [Bacteroidota bacterium]
MKEAEEMQTAKNELTTLESLPNLHEAKVSPREMSSTYWTPDRESEYKVGVVMSIKEESYQNETTGEVIQLPCIIMLAQEEDGSFSTIRNGSKRLVATIEAAMETGEMVLEKTPVRITYLGKTKNKTNSYLSDRWSVKPIIL